jgi:hypothetical protein
VSRGLASLLRQTLHGVTASCNWQTTRPPTWSNTAATVDMRLFVGNPRQLAEYLYVAIRILLDDLTTALEGNGKAARELRGDSFLRSGSQHAFLGKRNDLPLKRIGPLVSDLDPARHDGREAPLLGLLDHCSPPFRTGHPALTRSAYESLQSVGCPGWTATSATPSPSPSTRSCGGTSPTSSGMRKVKNLCPK